MANYSFTAEEVANLVKVLAPAIERNCGGYTGEEEEIRLAMILSETFAQMDEYYRERIREKYGVELDKRAKRRPRMRLVK